jgi:hypothetical protein
VDAIDIVALDHIENGRESSRPGLGLGGIAPEQIPVALGDVYRGLGDVAGAARLAGIRKRAERIEPRMDLDAPRVRLLDREVERVVARRTCRISAFMLSDAILSKMFRISACWAPAERPFWLGQSIL